MSSWILLDGGAPRGSPPPLWAESGRESLSWTGVHFETLPWQTERDTAEENHTPGKTICGSVESPEHGDELDSYCFISVIPDALYFPKHPL